jgi:hypothetical protein
MGRDLLLHFDGMEGFDKTVFKSSAEWLLQKGYAFDLVSDKQLLNVKSNGSKLQTGGVSYKTILLADTKYLPLETLTRLTQAAAAGATIIFYKHLPAGPPGMSSLQQQQSEFIKLLANIPFTTVGAIQKAAVGKGYFLLGDDLEQLLREASTTRETMVDQGLQYARRSYAEGHYYFISNPTKTPVTSWVPLEVKEKNMVLYDPMTLAAGTAKTRIENGSVQVFLQLQPGASCILETKKGAVTGNAYPYYAPTEQVQLLDGKWSIRFLYGGPVLPAASDLQALGSWTDLAGSETKNFSGTAQYSIHFSKPAFIATNYLLDLGSVQESAEVMLNGKTLATLIGPSYQVIIPAIMLQKDNLLQVNVTNGMANRIADLDKRGVVWKKFYNTNFPARLPQNRGADGIFTAAGWLPKASGLIGPVTIQGTQTIK